MALYLALFRGINVGGHNKVKMADLKTCMENAGLNDVRTYIQSGNMLFYSDEGEESLRQRISQAFEASFGFAPAVVLRTAEELKRLIENRPFSDEVIAEAQGSGDFEVFYVVFFDQAPSEQEVKRMETYRIESDAFVLLGRDLYILLRHSIRDSKLAGYVSKLDATARNWNTVTKLNGMAEEMAQTH